MNKEELIDYLINEAELDPGYINNARSYDLIDEWLKYNGIIGFTDEILSVVGAAIDIAKLQQNLLEALNPLMDF